MNPPRPFWQLHLSTAVLLMLAAAMLLWLNLRAVPRDELLDYETVLTMERGWPVPFQQQLDGIGMHGTFISAAALIFDIAVALVTLAWIAVIGE